MDDIPEDIRIGKALWMSLLKIQNQLKTSFYKRP